MDKQASQNTQEEVISVIAFRLEKQTFALPLQVIVQILPMMEITPIPHLSHIVKGSINVRGEAILVISLRLHFNLPEKAPQLYTPLLLLNIHNRPLALIVDEVLDVMNLPLENLDALENILPEGIENTPLLQGLGYFNDETILVLNPDQLFYNQNFESANHNGTGVESHTPVSA